MVRDNHIQNTAIPQVCQSDCAPVIGICYTNRLRNIHELSGSVIQPYSFLLITGEAASIHGGPIFSVSNNRAVPARNLGKIVPIASISIE